MDYQKSGKDLMTMDEIAVMDGDKCILQLRGVRPFLPDKYDETSIHCIRRLANMMREISWISNGFCIRGLR